MWVLSSRRLSRGGKIIGTHPLESNSKENVSLDSVNKLGCPPLPLEGYLDNTRFGATKKGLPHLKYILNRGILPKIPAEKLGSGPYITIKI